MSLKFILQAMEATILVQIRGFKDFWFNEKGKEHIITQKLFGLDWNKSEDKITLCKRLVNFMNMNFHFFFKVQQGVQVIKEHSGEFFEYVNLLTKRSEKWRLLNTFVWTECSSLLQLLQSIQSGNHTDRTTSLKQIIPSFFRKAFDKRNILVSLL